MNEINYIYIAVVLNFEISRFFVLFLYKIYINFVDETEKRKSIDTSPLLFSCNISKRIRLYVLLAHEKKNQETILTINYKIK